MKHTSSMLAGYLGAVFIMSAFVSLVPLDRVQAETQVNVPCQDGTTGIAIRSSKGLTSADYDAACKGHGGAAGEDEYTSTGTPSTAGTSSGVNASLTGSGNCPPDNLLGIPAWYTDLRENPDAGNCELKKVGDGGMSLNSFIIKIALNVIRAGLVIAGYVAVFFIIKGGFLYITAQGEPSNLTTAKQTITNAIIGLIIALLSSAIVGAIAGAIN